jgi:hypothetical protein
MTLSEAKERVSAIWVGRNVSYIQLRPDGGVDVNLDATHGRYGDMRERGYAYHRLDANGHVACHSDCQSLER